MVIFPGTTRRTSSETRTKFEKEEKKTSERRRAVEAEEEEEEEAAEVKDGSRRALLHAYVKKKNLKSGADADQILFYR